MMEKVKLPHKWKCHLLSVETEHAEPNSNKFLDMPILSTCRLDQLLGLYFTLVDDSHIHIV